jgi:hypothetical protein
MTRTARDPVTTTADGKPSWADLFPADPELMASAEGDVKGLAEVKQQARERIARTES